MLYKVAELHGELLDAAVAKCEEILWCAYDDALNNEKPLPSRPSEFLRDNNSSTEFSPSTDWAQGGPIIERERLLIQPHGLSWESSMGGNNWFKGGAPLSAAMRCYVASKFGYEIEL